MCICQFAPLMWKIDRAGREQQRRKRERETYSKSEQIILSIFFLFSLSLRRARTPSLSVCLPFLLFRVIQKEEKNEPKRRKKQSIAQHHYRRHRHTRAKLSPSCFAIRSLLHLSLSFIDDHGVFSVVVTSSIYCFLIIFLRSSSSFTLSPFTITRVSTVSSESLVWSIRKLKRIQVRHETKWRVRSSWRS